ncbi:hypothetical protein, partial [Chryseobacterium sp. CH1]|uniref:hypothetical protein n=1 Tax=Chryseobacterium sp. CH1 TaxID=713551 RepID=UPI001E29D323
RVQAGIFTTLAANAYSSFKSKRELNYRLELNEKIAELKTKFLKHNYLFDSLIESKTEIQNLPEAEYRPEFSLHWLPMPILLLNPNAS